MSADPKIRIVPWPPLRLLVVIQFFSAAKRRQPIAWGASPRWLASGRFLSRRGRQGFRKHATASRFQANFPFAYLGLTSQAIA